MIEIETIWLQIRDAARERYRGEDRIAHIRITTDAIPGSIVAMPITPERMRSLGYLRLVQPTEPGPATVIADPSRELLEIVMHPKDWRQLRMSLEARDHLETGALDKADRLLGYPVI